MEGAAGTVSPTPMKSRDPRRREGDRGGEGDQDCTPGPQRRAPGMSGARLPPWTSQLWPLHRDHPRGPSHSPAGQAVVGDGSAAQGHGVHHLLQLAPEPLPPCLLVLLQGRQDLRRWEGGIRPVRGLGVAHSGRVQSGLQAEATVSLPLAAEGPGPGAGTPRPRVPGVSIRPSSPKTTRTGLRSPPALQVPEHQGPPPAPAGPAGLCAHTPVSRGGQSAPSTWPCCRLPPQPHRPTSLHPSQHSPSGRTAARHPQVTARPPRPCFHALPCGLCPSVPGLSHPLPCSGLPPGPPPPVSAEGPPAQLQPPCSDLQPGLLHSRPHPLKPAQKSELAPEPSGS